MMAFHLAPWVLLAAADVPEEPQTFSYEVITLPELLAPAVPWFALVFLAALIYASVARMLKKPAVQQWFDARRVFGELCRAHRLDGRSRRRLEQLIAVHRLAHPALVFIRPDLFHSARLPAQLRHLAKQFEQLSDRLFSTTDETTGGPRAPDVAVPAR